MIKNIGVTDFIFNHIFRTIQFSQIHISVWLQRVEDFVKCKDYTFLFFSNDFTKVTLTAFPIFWICRCYWLIKSLYFFCHTQKTVITFLQSEFTEFVLHYFLRVFLSLNIWNYNAIYQSNQYFSYICRKLLKSQLFTAKFKVGNTA